MWLPILSALASTATPSTAERLDLVVASIVSRLEASGNGLDGPTWEEERELASLCGLGMEMACRLRVAESGWDRVVAHADGPCVPSMPCPPQPVVLPAFEPMPVRQMVDPLPRFAEVHPSFDEGPLIWLPNGGGASATCALDGTMHVAAPGRYRFTGVRCGAFRWGPDGNILWVHTRGSLVAIEPESGAAHRWIVAGLYAQPSVPSVAEDGQVWLQPMNGASCGTGALGWMPDRLDTWGGVPLVSAEPAPGIAGLWQGLKGQWLWVEADVGRRAAQHGPLVVVDGRLAVLRGDQLRLDVSGNVWERVPSEPPPVRLVKGAGRAGPDLTGLRSSASGLPPGRQHVWLWGDGGPFSASVSSHGTGCASGPCDVFLVVSHRERSLPVEGSLRHYPDGRWVFAGRSCPRAHEMRRPTECALVELRWQEGVP